MSFDEVYRKHYHELRRFGRQLNVPVDISEDLTQEVFLRFYLELNRNVVFENPRAWLYKVLLNLFKTQINSGKRLIADSEIPVGIYEPITDLQEEYATNEKQRIVFEMLGRLTEREQQILLLYNSGFSYAEMAEIMEINANSVGKTLVRAIEGLKELLKMQYHEMFE